MGRRVVGVIVAAVLAIAGTAALITYVNNAAERERSGEERVAVLVAAEPIPAGTPADDVGALTTISEVPARLVATGAVGELTEFSGLVTEGNIYPGEQILSQQFVSVGGFVERDTGVEIPPNMLEVTVPVGGPPAVGGIIRPGNTVAILFSFTGDTDSEGQTATIDNGEVVPLPSDDDNESEVYTTILMRNVLVTGYQEGGAEVYPNQLARSTARLTTPPGGNINVTVALTPGNVERLVFATTYGSLWLALEHPDVTLEDGPVRTPDNILENGS